MEIGRKKEDKEKKRSRQLENIIFLSELRYWVSYRWREKYPPESCH
ncbi:hypothetical protein [Microcoleus sp. D2_18a_B4]